VPGRLLVFGLSVDALLFAVELAIFDAVLRCAYRARRRTTPPFEAFLEALRDVEPVLRQVFALMAAELRGLPPSLAHRPRWRTGRARLGRRSPQGSDPRG